MRCGAGVLPSRVNDIRNEGRRLSPYQGVDQVRQRAALEGAKVGSQFGAPRTGLARRILQPRGGPGGLTLFIPVRRGCFLDISGQVLHQSGGLNDSWGGWLLSA